MYILIIIGIFSTSLFPKWTREVCDKLVYDMNTSTFVIITFVG